MSTVIVSIAVSALSPDTTRDGGEGEEGCNIRSIDRNQIPPYPAFPASLQVSPDLTDSGMIYESRVFITVAGLLRVLTSACDSDAS